MDPGPWPPFPQSIYFRKFWPLQMEIFWKASFEFYHLGMSFSRSWEPFLAGLIFSGAVFALTELRKKPSGPAFMEPSWGRQLPFMLSGSVHIIASSEWSYLTSCSFYSDYLPWIADTQWFVFTHLMPLPITTGPYLKVLHGVWLTPLLQLNEHMNLDNLRFWIT